jgi:hypothetical protein
VTARNLLVGALAAGVVGAMVLRPLAHGVSGFTVAVFWATALGQVVVPGVLLCHGARLGSRRDPWLVLGQGATLGLAIQGLSLLAGRAIGAHGLPALAAVATGLAGLLLARGARRDAVEVPPASPVPLLAVVLGAVLIQPLASSARLGDPIPFDMLFHAGTAAELRHRWPLEDPRVAGVPLHYHVLSYALPVEAADRSGAPLFDPLLALAPPFWVALLGLQLANAGRVLFRDGWAGALGAAVALFHTDPGAFLGLGPGAFNSHLATGIFGSPTTVCGLVLLAGLAVSLEGWIEHGDARHLAACGLLAAAASGAKTTVMPVVLGGLALAAGHALVLRRPAAPRRWTAALVVTALAAAPLTLWQTTGPASYSGMVRLGPGAAFAGSGFAAAATGALGPGARALFAVPLFVAWLAGYLGLAGVGAAVWLARVENGRRAIQSWALGVAAAGLATSLLLDVPDLSQLFLLYNGQVLLSLFAGAALVRVAHPSRARREVVATVVLAFAALPAVHHLARVLPAAVRADGVAANAPTPQLTRAYLEALDWLRVHASGNAVVFADNPSLVLSAIGEVRLFYENGTYTAQARRTSASREPWPERLALQERLLRRPDRAAVAEARRAVGPGPRLLVVADAVPTRIEAGFVWIRPGPVPGRRLFPESLFERRFANAAVHVYAARD